jgi:peptide-methionine (S)-S-oxide reductase
MNRQSMIGRPRAIAAALVLSVFAIGPAAAAPRAEQSKAADPAAPALSAVPPGAETAVFAGGCFWGVEGVFERLNGVLDATAGYSGGEESTAHYDMVSTGETGHAESVRVVFDPAKVSYTTLLRVFFTVAHDPTELNYQGPDVGTQYRSAIFYAGDAQRKAADDFIQSLARAGTYKSAIVTQVVPLAAFYPAEEYHQHFMDRNPTYPYIVYWDAPKVAQLQRQYPELVAKR